ncbi:GTP cyclohydrolase I FolE [Hephaestia sp. GCM10023244]|uniref:GTP cyclohydrolase I FolE n=2 Tax=unclassified Hephaestia TaxID=2631281 RepID=UPI00362150B8
MKTAHGKNRMDYYDDSAPMDFPTTDEPRDYAHRSTAGIEQAVRTMIAATGDNPDREGLLDTPARVARAWREWFAGYAIDPAALLARTFTEAAGYEDTITLRSTPVVSTCEHHLAPITGVAHVAYRPGASVVGISKLSRLVDAYARRLQLQERLTSQIAHTLDDVLKPRGVAVVVEARHGCMSSRGVNQHGVSLVTHCWLGDFRDDPALRRELLDTLPRSRCEG